jgi:glutamyl-tRNA synthetase
LRTALFNYLFSRAAGGTFLLRIEDTDQARYDESALQDIFDTFAWLGMTWDEGPEVGGPHAPYFQSERLDLYRSHAEQLVEQGDAYWAYDAPDEHEAQDSKAGYDRRGRYLTDEQKAEYQRQGIKPVVRFKAPLEGETVIDDVLLGKVKRKNKDVVPDPVLLKSDGFPTYHLANVIDDHYMEITHVLRAQEWVPSAPVHVQLYRAFGWEPPQFCHLPVVLGKDGQKLSKRHGATSVIEFRRQGYLPEALMNYVVRLGWSYDDSRELFTKEELESLFSLERLNKSPGAFDYKKLEWFNGVYIRERSDEDIRELIRPYMEDAGLVHSPPTAEEEEILRGAVPIIKERLKTLSDAPTLLRFLFQEVEDYDPGELIPKKMSAGEARAALEEALALLPTAIEHDEEKREELFRARAEELGMKLGSLLMPLRVAITGSKVSPPLFESIGLLGYEKSVERVERAIEFLRSEESNG